MLESKFAYWIRERESIRRKKEAGEPPPWSDDPVFQTTYFCNVRREDDKVTKWIRNSYSDMVYSRTYEYNIILARMLNRIETLEAVGYQHTFDTKALADVLYDLARNGKTVWGNAYIITTHGIPMGKLQYLTDNVLGSARDALEGVQREGVGAWHGRQLQTAHRFLEGIEGLGSFLAAQVVADLKNTEGHPLSSAPDWWSFVAHGPGSLRGLSWFHYGEIGRVTPATFLVHFNDVVEFFDKNVQDSVIPNICNQDLQNCLCEFDKYMRVSTGSGRSKRSYNGLRRS